MVAAIERFLVSCIIIMLANHFLVNVLKKALACTIHQSSYWILIHLHATSYKVITLYLEHPLLTNCVSHLLYSLDTNAYYNLLLSVCLSHAFWLPLVLKWLHNRLSRFSACNIETAGMGVWRHEAAHSCTRASLVEYRFSGRTMLLWRGTWRWRPGRWPGSRRDRGKWWCSRTLYQLHANEQSIYLPLYTVLWYSCRLLLSTCILKCRISCTINDGYVPTHV